MDSAMTDKDYSLRALNDFLDYLSSKHLLNKNTAQSRKAAVNKVLGVLDAEEASDLSKVDLDLAFRRFENKSAKDYKPDSLMVYRSRVGSALNDFFSYLESPTQFRPSVKANGSGAAARPAKTSRKAEGERSERRTSAREDEQTETPAMTERTHALSVPVPLRDGVMVRITGLPADLTEAEAARLAAIVKAYAVV